MMKRFVVAVAVLAGVCAAASNGFAQEQNRVDVRYFHGTFRCVSCTRIEQYTRDALKERFAAELASGVLRFAEVNLEEKGNEHYVNDYKLYTKSVVLSLVVDGKEVRYLNLDKVWHLLRDKKGFYDYIETETRKFLTEAQGGS